MIGLKAKEIGVTIDQEPEYLKSHDVDISLFGIYQARLVVGGGGIAGRR